MKLLLTGCGKTKAPTATAAADLYTGTLCKLRAEYARAACDAADAIERFNETPGNEDIQQVGANVRWFILSAAHGLLNPSKVIEPYNADASDFAPEQRARWAMRVAMHILEIFAAAGGSNRDHSVEIHAGANYAKQLAAMLRAAGIAVHWWSEGLQIGEQQECYVNVRKNRAHLADTDAREAADAADLAATIQRHTRQAAERKAARVGGPFVVERQGQLFADAA